MQDVVRICADWARHGTEGVIACLETVPLEAGITRLTMLTITDECTDEAASLQQTPTTGLPVLQIMRGSQLLSESRPAVKPMPADGTPQIGFRFITKHNDARVTLAEADQVARAVRRCLKRMFCVPGNEVMRTRNQVQVTDFRSWDEEVAVTHENTLLTLTLVATLTVRDLYTSAS